MPQPAAIKATFADYKRIRTRKLGQLIFEIPLEELHNAIETLGGEPSVEGDTWVAIARLDLKGGDANPNHKTAEHVAQPDVSDKPASGHKRLSELRRSAQAALMCEREEFWRFLEDDAYDASGLGAKAYIQNSEEAATIVRSMCKVQSRREFDTDPKAAQRWRELYTSFTASRLAEQHGRH